MAGQECGKDQAELWNGGTIAFPSEHKTKLVRNRSVPFRSVPFRPRLNMALKISKFSTGLMRPKKVKTSSAFKHPIIFQ